MRSVTGCLDLGPRTLEYEGENSKAINIARLWALTGCRRDEIAALTWSEVDEEEGLLHLGDTKTGKSQVHRHLRARPN